MTRHFATTLVLWTVAGLGLATGGALRADGSADMRQEVRDLKQRNVALEELVRKQAAVIEGLNRRVTDIERASANREGNALSDADSGGTSTSSGFSLGKVNIGGEGGVALFHTGREGMWPNTEFRVDEARLFVEAPVWGEVYFFTELNLATREHDDLALRLGELYLDFENVSQLWGQERQMNIRVGRLDIPFGEEYQKRDAIDNPLVSHSLADLWGVDEGVEIYGSLGKFSYVVAVQNGGVSGTRDFNSDKSVVGRVAFDPTRWLHLSASAMRTGDLEAKDDFLSELWFGNGWFRSIGSTNTTAFHANLIEGDIAVRLPHGHLKAFGGYICYDDNDTARNNQRGLYYYSVEGVHHFTRKFYAAARFSQIFAVGGYPLAGHGDLGDYFFSWNPAEYADEIWRLSLGLGWRFSDHLLFKVEYSLERGDSPGGDPRDHEDFFGAEAAFKF